MITNKVTVNGCQELAVRLSVPVVQAITLLWLCCNRQLQCGKEQVCFMALCTTEPAGKLLPYQQEIKEQLTVLLWRWIGPWQAGTNVSIGLRLPQILHMVNLPKSP
jgi:hypothetical protein